MYSEPSMCSSLFCNLVYVLFCSVLLNISHLQGTPRASVIDEKPYPGQGPKQRLMHLIGVCLFYLAVCLITIHYTSWGSFPSRWRQIAQLELEWTRPDSLSE
ncbi:uncharacterized protein F5147DRAFT_688117 [Suillus discolor]|uniref:Uncharacterized protein n=1 Tax=Suillus discolor TaxID=1912936 RepID=A0A9P7F9B7_9AGAM|nr:uncharacterized protein F5147DRAFT_688117 [Suillus discolor]KAG2110966.1 hypothetical protein F5147DRAFT_688117 [Suillus discolor]